MIDLTKLQFTSKQLTAICKKFSYFESNPNSKLKFKPDPESNVIYPGKAEALGRRKSSVAQVKLTAGKGTMTINGKSATSYLQKNLFLLTRIEAPLYFLSLNDYVSLSITVKGGGLIGQADAIKLGISRALCNYNIDYRYPLRNKGYLTRDARIKERKKYGLKKARKAPQYSKR
nr:ribosomal protein S9 [Blidingia minima]